MSEAVTDGERLFEEYLKLRALNWRKDQAFGIKKPDYLVAADVTDVLCEVKDFGEGKLDKATIKAGLISIRAYVKEDREYLKEIDAKLASLQHVTASNGGAWDPYDRLQEMVAEAAKQLRPAKGKLPCVVVIHNPGFMPHERDLILRIALGKNRLFTPKHNTTVSGLAVLERIYPNKHLLTDRLHEKAEEVKGRRPKSIGFDRQVALEMLEEVGALEERLRAEHGNEFFDAFLPRVRVYHNKYAVLGLPREVFAGSNDVQLSAETLWDREFIL